MTMKWKKAKTPLDEAEHVIKQLLDIIADPRAKSDAWNHAQIMRANFWLQKYGTTKENDQ
jgi:hypothetical protein